MIFRKTPRIDTSEAAISDILNRGVEDVFIKEELEKKLRSGKQLRVKLGIDPTSPHIHLGRAVVLRKLRRFQDLGHQVVLIVGDFTAQVGDPSDKLEKRPMLTRDHIATNLKNYKKVIGKIIDVDKAEFVYNSKWLAKLGFQEISELAESFSVQQMVNRRNFKERIEKGQEISLREFLYPLMQGYDSVAVRADVELGGFDQLFNVKAGRTIQKHYGQREQDIMTVEMLEGTDGRKMSSSWGNVISISDAPNDMYGKIMSVHDDLIEKYFVLGTDVPLTEIEGIKRDLTSGTNPRDIKMRLAREIVALYAGKAAAAAAEQVFVQTFSKGEIPEDTVSASVAKGTLLADVMVGKGIVSSKTDWRRLVGEGAVRNAETDEKITDQFAKAEVSATYKVGKRRFIKIIVE